METCALAEWWLRPPPVESRCGFRLRRSTSLSENCVRASTESFLLAAPRAARMLATNTYYCSILVACFWGRAPKPANDRQCLSTNTCTPSACASGDCHKGLFFYPDHHKRPHWHIICLPHPHNNPSLRRHRRRRCLTPLQATVQIDVK